MPRRLWRWLGYLAIFFVSCFLLNIAFMSIASSENRPSRGSPDPQNRRQKQQQQSTSAAAASTTTSTERRPPVMESRQSLLQSVERWNALALSRIAQLAVSNRGRKLNFGRKCFFHCRAIRPKLSNILSSFKCTIASSIWHSCFCRLPRQEEWATTR